MTRFVAKCSDCGEQKILDERFSRCKSCFQKWFEKGLVPADFITDPDQWYILAPSDDTSDLQPDPAKVDAAVARMKTLSEEAQRKINLVMRDILRKGIATKDLRYNLPKCGEKI